MSARKAALRFGTAVAGARRAHPGLVVTDLAELASRLAAAGIETTYDESIPGTKRFYVADPFGNRLEFRQA